MNFNFSEVSSQSTSRAQLQGNAIYDVKFDGCEARDFQAKNDPSKTYRVLEIKFSNKDGYFTHTVFEPTDRDFQDQPNQWGTGNNPSGVATMAYLFKHLIDAVNPVLAEKINKGEVIMDINPNNWDAVRKFMVDATSSGVGTETKIKLLKNRAGNAIFTYFLQYNREGKLYMSTNFIGNNIFFIYKELRAISSAQQAKPTNTESFTFSANTTNNNDDDFDDDII